MPRTTMNQRHLLSTAHGQAFDDATHYAATTGMSSHHVLVDGMLDRGVRVISENDEGMADRLAEVMEEILAENLVIPPTMTRAEFAHTLATRALADLRDNP